MLLFMQTSESEEGPSSHISLALLGKLTQVWVYIRKIQDVSVIYKH